ncbi:hypothetical protein Mal15_30280 [Stieleria maiorica]|uniref:Tetratricopeptide repeat protein n=1 Tax=Stieleria maiorica TaxID=2795974 RepID=A0A5B9MG21_9BACT|nr:hypothetical protein [Stieleria maiorica]QEF98970.1 hypothetical protein Mal15_30280 [Stieleria maiorica]
MSNTKKSSSAVESAVNHTFPSAETLPERIAQQIQNNHYVAAYDALRTLPRSPLNLSCLGVLAMRIGHAEEAIRVFRGMVLTPGTTICRSDAGDTLLINYATALLLGNLPSGALDVLGNLQNRDALPAVQIRSAIKRWASGLSFWRRWDWKLNHIEPPNCSVPIDFAPGIFPIAIQSHGVTLAESELGQALDRAGRHSKHHQLSD